MADVRPESTAEDAHDNSTRARLIDVAREAGVSTATVDRVLNQRPGVKPATAQRVLRVATALEYLPDESRYSAVLAKPLKVVFLLPQNNNAFIRLLGDYVEIMRKIFAAFNIDCHVRFIPEFDHETLSHTLRKVGKCADGIVVVALEHPSVRDAVKQLVQDGKHVITLLSELPNSQRSAYVGLNNHAAGRTAAFMMGRQIGERDGKVALIAGSLGYRAHHEREMGFQQAQQEFSPQLTIVGTREGQEDPERTYQLTRDILQQHPDLVGIYNIGGACDGIARALKEAKLERKIRFIGHEVTSVTRTYLVDGTIDLVIAQNPHAEIMNALHILVNLRDGKPPMAGIENIPIGIFVRENLP